MYRKVEADTELQCSACRQRYFLVPSKKVPKEGVIGEGLSVCSRIQTAPPLSFPDAS